LAVIQVLAGLRYNDLRLFEILGGENAMIESPILNEFVAKRERAASRIADLRATRRSILKVLAARFGADAQQLQPALDAIEDDGRLDEVVDVAAVCPALQTFRDRLASG